MRLGTVAENRFAGVLAFATALLTLVTLVIGYHLPPETGEVGVIFPPWFDEPAAVSAIISAGGTLAGGTRFSNILVAVAPDPDFATRVIKYGALLITSARGLCAPIEGLEA
ncbi:hypothetical protein JHC09_16320 [Devosia sp. MC532]|uniref:hypothetical protein n=1 Tax=unclassified Devosia TaxID=196773 RepID=UPI0018F59965|nr:MULTISPECIES: hypothetical protein [unclassified Devosia]MBJ7579441.1 hypothetical protein [Devosia sp. MC532]MBK1793599.1 hypothetical protein [Devosia sp. WQ 349K1]